MWSPPAVVSPDTCRGNAYVDDSYGRTLTSRLSTSTLEQSLHVLLAVLVSCLEVVEFLFQVRDLRLHIHCFLGLSSLDILGGSEYEPIAMVSRGCPAMRCEISHILPTPSYTGVSCGRVSSSLEDNSSIRVSRFLEAIWPLTIPSCCWAKAAFCSISCRSYWRYQLVAQTAGQA